MAGDDVEQLLREIRAARAALPAGHREILDQLGVQETPVEDWPSGVIDLYRTLNEAAPSFSSIAGAAAVWLDDRRTVAFNTTELLRTVQGLTAQSRHSIVAGIAWHEYGHALSVNRATAEHRRHGPELLELLPPAMRALIDYPGEYRTRQVFDELVAHVYALLVGRVRTTGYGRPSYLHPDVYLAFTEVIPWP